MKNNNNFKSHKIFLIKKYYNLKKLLMILKNKNLIKMKF